MKKTISIVIVLIIIILGIYFIASNGNSNVPQNTQNSNPQTNPATSGGTSANLETTKPDLSVTKTTTPADVTVNIQNFSFSPSTLNIKTGTKVTWVNNDNVPHTVTSDSGSLLNSATLSKGQSFSFTFTNEGSISYHCNIHPMMKGSVVVSK